MITLSAAVLTVQQVAALGDAQKPAFNDVSSPILMAYAEMYGIACAGTTRVQPCMLAAIVERESGGRNVLQNGMPAGPGCGVGLTQITSGVDWSDSTKPCFPNYGALLDPQTNLRVCAQAFLEPLLAQFPSDRLAAFAAYNAGPGAIAQALDAGEPPDSRTTGNNYGSSVFKSWINFTAASLGHAVDWTTYQLKD